MTTIQLRVWVAAAAMLLAASTPATQDAAETFFGHLESERFEQAHAMFAEAAAAALTAAQLQATWKALPTQVGDYRGRSAFREETVSGRTIQVARLDFSGMPLDARISVDEAGRIDGFRLLPASQAPEQRAASSTADWHEIETTVAGDLPALLTEPVGSGPFPAAVFVHGSGPNDRDQTLGPNKPFRDLAHGLARSGIASLRYDTRAYVEPRAFVDRAYTVEEQVIADVRAAIRKVKQHPAVDSDRVFVVGHSLGAMLAPRIAAGHDDLAGIALLAAPARPLNEIVVDQVRYIASIDGAIDAAERRQIDALRGQSGAAAALSDLDSSTPAMLGQPESWWADLNAYDPVAVARALELPMFIAQGGRDYQVTVDDDLVRWLEAFEGDPRVTLRRYPDLNHLFISGKGMATPAEYLNIEGTVDARLIGDLAEWILQ